jgi:hypothetical protein
MEEFLFGTVAIDKLKIVHHRVSRTGLQHAHEILPRDPAPGEPVRVRVTVAPDLPAEKVVCYYTVDGSEPAGSLGEPQNGYVIPLQRVGCEWDTFLWGYLTLWEGTLPPQAEGATVRYRIGAWQEGAGEISADWPDVKATTDAASGAFFRSEPIPESPRGDPSTGVTFTFAVDRLQPPPWARQALIYHIFIDRFFPGEGKGWLQTEDLRDFCGGTLWGVLEKLDYIVDLGATCLWLSPVFPSPTTHGYDATDYMSVEPRMGGDEALRELVRAAHGRGLRVVLDLVCNHLSNLHPYFLEAQKNPRSPYRDWFFFDDDQVGYRAFFGVRSMPQVNLSHPAARRWMLDIARYWLREFDVDGYRLDHANGPGPSFWPDFWAACKEEKPDCFCFGEVVEPADVLRRYVGRLDGVLDFHFTDALRRTLAYGTRPAAAFEQFVRNHLEYFPADFLLLNAIDNHDMDRFLFIAGNSKDRLRQAAEIQMRLPGPPVIYYGTEVGLSQTVSKSDAIGLEASRMPMAWGDTQDGQLLDFYKALILERHQNRPWQK